MSGAFSGLLAAAIAQMDGVGGYEGWRWIFILEGVVTVVLGLMTFFLLIDTPELSHGWLDAQEIRFLQLQGFIKQGGRFNAGADENRHVSKDVWLCITNYKLWLLAFVQFAQSATSYGTKFNLPTITRAMGYRGSQAQVCSFCLPVTRSLDHRAVLTVIAAHVGASVRHGRPLGDCIFPHLGSLQVADAVCRHPLHYGRHWLRCYARSSGSLRSKYRWRLHRSHPSLHGDLSVSDIKLCQNYLILF